MRIVHATRLFVLLGVISALFLPAVQARAAFDAYMTITAARQGHIQSEPGSEKIQLTGVARDTPNVAGDTHSGMSTGRRTHSTITITKEIDKASPMLAQASGSHETLTNVTIIIVGGSGAKVAQKIVLNNAVILSLRKAGGREMITLDYESIEVTYTQGGKTASDDWNAPS